MQGAVIVLEQEITVDGVRALVDDHGCTLPRRETSKVRKSLLGHDNIEVVFRVLNGDRQLVIS